MFGIEALDVVIGLIFVYLLFSLFVSIVNEMLSQFLNVRGKELRFAIEKMIGINLKEILYDNPRIDRSKFKSSIWYGTPFWWIRKLFTKEKYLKSDRLEDKIVNKSDPASIPTPTFTELIIEMIKDDDLREELFDKAPFLEVSYEKVNQRADDMRSVIDNWFDEIMMYTSAWYKEKLRYVLILLGFMTAIIFNVDSLSIVKKLADDPEARKAIVAQAESYVDRYENQNGQIVLKLDNVRVDSIGNNPVEIESKLLKLKNDIDKRLINEGVPDSIRSDSVYSVIRMQFPKLIVLDSLYTEIQVFTDQEIINASSILGIGWGSVPKNDWSVTVLWIYFKMLIGWLITALAISMGAPFWFDLLKKVVNLKNELKSKAEVNTSIQKERVG